MSSGYIYILTNASFVVDVLKIGKTTRSVERRAKELSDKTGMPTAFSIAYAVKVPDCDKAEQEIHGALDRYRTNAKREFFRLSLKNAIEAVWAVAERQIMHRLAVSEWELGITDDSQETHFHAAAREARKEILKRVMAKDPDAWDPSLWKGRL